LHLEVHPKRGTGQDANGIETWFAARFRIADEQKIDGIGCRVDGVAIGSRRLNGGEMPFG
jgi:hypothetical protein